MMLKIVVFVAALAWCEGQFCPNASTALMTCGAKLTENPEATRALASAGNNFSGVILDLACRPSTIPTIEELMRCIYNSAVDCLPSTVLKYLPKAEAIIEARRYYCANKNDFNLACASKNMDTVWGCMNETLTEPDMTTDESLLAWVCSVQQQMTRCAKLSLGSCPKRTAEVVTTMIGYTNPNKCAVSSTNGSAKPGHRLSPPLLICLICLINFLKKLI